MFEEIGKLIDKKEEPGRLDKAIDLLIELKKEDPANDIIRGKLAHAYFYKGYFSPEKSRERHDYFEKGLDFGNQAVTLNPRAIYGNYWYGANMGMLGICKGIMASLKSINPMRKAMEIVLEENDRFFFAGPHRTLGRLFHQAPGWPISIGNKTKAADHLEQAVELAPNFFHNRLLLAEFYIDIGKKNKAKEHIDYLIDTPLNPDHQIEDGRYQNEAKTLLNKIY